MIHLVKLISNDEYPYWVTNDTYGALRCGIDIPSAVAQYKEQKFKLQGASNDLVIQGDCLYDKTILDGHIILSCKRISDINSTKYPELFI